MIAGDSSFRSAAIYLILILEYYKTCVRVFYIPTKATVNLIHKYIIKALQQPATKQWFS